MLASEHRSRMMLPEQVLGQALLYLVAAVGRRVVFNDPRRFAAALYDEAWALLASPYGQNLLIEGVRDGRKHNGAIWLASQHPNDFAVSELADLLGSRFVFRQARQAIPTALGFLGAADSADAAATLEHGLGNGQCLYRDVRERIGLIQVLPPALPEVVAAFETAPAAAEEGGTASDEDDIEADDVVEAPAALAGRRGVLVAPRALAVPAPSDDGGLALPDELDDDGLSLADELDDDGLALADEFDDDGLALPDELDDVPVRRVDPGEAPALPVDNGAAPDDLSAARARARRRRRSPLAAALQPEEP
jgi:hypothetical protein